MLKTDLLVWTIVCITGTVGVLKNFITFSCLGKKFWSFMTILVGIGIGIAALKLPIEVIQVWTAVMGATLFYDTIFKIFQKVLENILKKEGE